MGRGEQSLAVSLSRVRKQAAEEQLVDKTGGAVTHGGGNLHKCPQVIIDDHLASQAEFLAIGVELVLRRFLDDTAVFDFAVSGNRKKIADIGKSEAVILFEVVQVAGGTEFGSDNGLCFVALQKFFIGNVAQDSRQRHRAESRTNGFVVEASGIRNSIKFHTLNKELLQRHVHFTHTGFNGLCAVGFFQGIGIHTATQTHCGFKCFAHFTAFGFGFDRNVHAGGRTFGTDSFQDLLGHNFGSPAGGNCLFLDFGELAVADSLNGADTLTFGFYGRNSGFFGSRRHISCTGGNRSRGGFGFRLFGFLLRFVFL